MVEAVEVGVKLATFRHGSTVAAGVVDPARALIVDLAAAIGDARLSTMQGLIEAGDGALAAAARALETAESGRPGTHALGAVRLLAPLPVPVQIRDFTNFPKHVVQAPVGMAKLAARLAGRPVPDLPVGPVPQVYRDRPVYYISNRFSVGGPDDDVLWPRYSTYMDYELEFAIVIGRGGVDIAPETAMEHVFGYTIFNDFSARDMQSREMQGWLGPTKGKSFAGGNVMGPWIVTRDEVPDPRALHLEARVNGKVWSSGTAETMLHGVAELIAYVSQDEPIMPGEIFGSGTIDDGCGLERDRYLADGDVVELEVAGIGVLRNRVLRGDTARRAA